MSLWSLPHGVTLSRKTLGLDGLCSPFYVGGIPALEMYFVSTSMERTVVGGKESLEAESRRSLLGYARQERAGHAPVMFSLVGASLSMN